MTTALATNVHNDVFAARTQQLRCTDASDVDTQFCKCIRIVDLSWSGVIITMYTNIQFTFARHSSPPTIPHTISLQLLSNGKSQVVGAKTMK